VASDLPAGSSRTISVLDSTMHVMDLGDGPPVLFLHGNPTSSFLWRHVLARRDPGWRCIAPDLIGMGRSGKPDISYRLVDHIAYVDALLEALQLPPMAIVGHDWGVAIALDRLRRFPEQVTGVAFMEGHVRPLPGWDAFDAGGRRLFQQLRADGVGERMVLEENFFIDTLLPAALLRPLPPEEMDTYGRPYPDPASRRPLLRWSREIPVGGQPADVTGILAAAAAQLASSPVPKLLLHGSPGAIIPPTAVGWFRGHLPALTVTDVGGPAGHFLPEDRPQQVADAIWTWLARRA
jgi:haloalkane dehalogenase